MSDKENKIPNPKRIASSLVTLSLPGLRRKGSMRATDSVVRGRSLRPAILHPDSQTETEAKADEVGNENSLKD